ncbi:MAG: EamA family transporter [Saprospiraceae bacterium]|nr:EamA family transporter [Saprospiraceae bacterium]
MTDKLRAYLILHFCVFIWGFTAILGKLISLSALPLVWWRVVLCVLALALLMPKGPLKKITPSQWRQMILIGGLIGIHWLCFYGAIKLANASVAVATMAMTSFFSALTEPWLLKQKIKWHELALGIAVLPGMALIAGNIDLNMRVGLAVGIVSSLLASIFTALNKKVLNSEPPPSMTMSFVELSAAVGITSLAMPFYLLAQPEAAFWPRGADWWWLLMLAWICTLLPFYLSLQAMRHISAFAVNLSLNLEPVYGILLAALIFKEHQQMGAGFYVGMCLILAAVFSHPFLKVKEK